MASQGGKMETVSDFEDMLELLREHGVRYLIVGGLAVIYHAKPRYTKDMDLWVDAESSNVDRANEALRQFPSPWLFEQGDPSQILQIGIAPHRIDLILTVEGVDFATAWEKRIMDRYGGVEANWIDIDTLLLVKSQLDDARHAEDAKLLRKAKEIQERRG